MCSVAAYGAVFGEGNWFVRVGHFAFSASAADRVDAVSRRVYVV
jgi:hypothetical protein